MQVNIFSSEGPLRHTLSLPPSTIPSTRYAAQSSLLGKRVDVEFGESKMVGGTVIRDDLAIGGISLAALDNGVMLGWSDEAAWAVQRTTKEQPYSDPNWNFPFSPGSPAPNGSVTPFFPTAPIPPTPTVIELSYVEEDSIVAEARVLTDAFLAHLPGPLRKSAELSSPIVDGPWKTLPLTGSYEDSAGQWCGWVEDEQRSWLAFVRSDGIGVVWREREGGKVVGQPLIFARDLATFALRRRGSVRKIRQYRGIEIHIDRPMGTTIEGVGPDGKSYVFQQKVDYGFFPGTLGDDLDEFDVYMGPHPLATHVYIIEQLRARSGWYDERKAIVGCNSAEEALEIYKAHVHPRMVGRIGRMTHEAFEKSLREHQKAVTETKKSARKPFLPVTEEDAAELAEMEAMREELEREWGKGERIAVTKADEVTNFPAKGDNKAVSLRNSNYGRFDLEYAQDLKDNHPAVWDLGGNIKGNKQFEILSRVQRQGGTPRTAAEEAAVRLREPWAARHYEDFRPPGVVAQIKWIVVGTLGEQKMKALINKEKDKRSDKSLDQHDRAPLSYPPPSSDFNPPDVGPSSVPPIAEPPPSSANPLGSTNAAPTTVDPLLVLPPMPPPKEAAAPPQKEGDSEMGEATKDVGPLSLRNPQPETTTMSNAIHQLINRTVAATLALAALGAVDIPQTERAALGTFLRGGNDAARVQGRKDAGSAPPVEGRGGEGKEGLIRKTFEIRAMDPVANVDRDNCEITFVASTPSVDSHGEVVAQEWLFERFQRNPVILWSHKQGELPIGRAVNWWVEQGKVLYIRVRFSKVYPFAQLVWEMILEDMIRACSVGFIPRDISRREIDGQMRTVLGRNELCELSICSVPSNPDAVIPPDFEAKLAERYERCAVELEQRIANLAEKTGQTTNNHNNSAPASGGTANGLTTRQLTPTAPANQGTTPSGAPRGQAIMSKMDQTYAKQQIREHGSLEHRCEKCGTDATIEFTGVREQLIAHERTIDGFKQREAKLLADLSEQKALVAKERGDKESLAAKLTEIELKSVVGVDPWQLSPIQARELAELRNKSGEEVYQSQLRSRLEQLEKVKSVYEENARLKGASIPAGGSASALPGTGVIPTVITGQPAAHQSDATPPAQKGADPVLSFLHS